MTAHVHLSGNAGPSWQRSQTAAERWRQGILKAAGSLENNPARCHLAPESPFFKTELRELLYGKRRGVYRIIFEIRADTVVVISIRHAARKFLHEEEL